MKENKPRCFECIFSDLVSVSRKKKRTPASSHTYRSRKGGERKTLVSKHKSAPPPHTHFFFCPQGKRKVSLIWGYCPAYPPPSFQAPFDEAGPGQEHRWLQGRGKTSVFMVEGVTSIWARPSNTGVCTWELNASSVWSHFLRLTGRKTPQPNSWVNLSTSTG